MDPRYGHYPPHGYYGAPPMHPQQPPMHPPYPPQYVPPQQNNNVSPQHFQPAHNYNGAMVAIPPPPAPFPQYPQPQYHSVGAYLAHSQRNVAPAAMSIPMSNVVNPIIPQMPEMRAEVAQPLQPPPAALLPHASPRPQSSSSTLSKPPSQKPKESPVEYQLLLLSLAEEYIAAAHGLGPMLSLIRKESELEQYHQLIATGLGCMEAVLRKFRLHPRMEATLSLRYATLLYEETENTAEAEAILSKGITLCERNRLLDLRYSMQHLLARVLFRTNSRAAYKYLDTAISESEAYQHVVWTYALRLLRVSLSLQNTSGTETLASIHQLRALSELSQAKGDRAVFVTCATLEAMVLLRSHGIDSIEQAQRAIASARSHQLQMTSKESAQILTLLNCVDLACALLRGTPDQAEAKMTTFQALIDEAGDNKSWSSDGLFLVPIDVSTSENLTVSTGNIFQKDPITNKVSLTFSWLPQRDLYALGYYLSAVTVHLCNKEKSSEYLLQGTKATNELLSVPDVSKDSIRASSSRAEWQTLIQWHMHLQLAFVYCSRADWASARRWLDRAQTTMDKNPILEVSEMLTRWTQYLQGVIEQGSGNPVTAFELYQSPIFSHPPNASARVADAHMDVCTLAALNTILIIREPGHPQHHLIEPLLTRIEPLCVNHPSKSLRSAFALTKAVAVKQPMLKFKELLKSALEAAKASSNQQVIALSLSLMCRLFFVDIVGSQAEKCGRAAQNYTKKANNQLWTCVADGMLANTLEKVGKLDEARNVKAEGIRLLQNLPPDLKEKCLNGDQ